MLGGSDTFLRHDSANVAMSSLGFLRTCAIKSNAWSSGRVRSELIRKEALEEDGVSPLRAMFAGASRLVPALAFDVELVLERRFSLSAS